ncbi:MAG: HD-GYP domain-containing protein, partial [Actinobacteria bacterium]
MTEVSRIPRSFVAVAMLLATSAAVLLAAQWGRTPPALTSQLLLLAIAAVLSESFALSLPAFQVSLAFPLVVATIVLSGPTAGGIVAGLTFTSIQEIRQRKPFPLLAFNFGQLVTSALAGGYVFVALGGRSLADDGEVMPLASSQLPAAVAAVLAASIVLWGVNAAWTAYAAHAVHGLSTRAVLSSMLRHLPTQAALALMGLLMAQVIAISPAAFPLFVFPLVLARQVYQRYESMREIYLDTVRSLIGALEARDPYTRGHSERVADYAAMICGQMGLDDRSTERVVRSALLHDIGKLAVAPQLLCKPGKLDVDEYEVMRRHPSVGAEMVSRFSPLRVLASNVGAHHERVDGQGYPSGLKGNAISLDARILAVADSFDAMTSKRAYRAALTIDEATDQLLAGSGSQFDSTVVDQFLR